MKKNNNITKNRLLELPEKENSSEWLKDFLKLPTLWLNLPYLSSCVITTGSTNPDKFLSIFNHRIKGFYKKYVESEQITEKELRQAIAVMIKESYILTEKNLLEVLNHISNGFYRSYLIDFEEDVKYYEEEKKRNAEYEKLKEELEDIDWEDI